MSDRIINTSVLLCCTICLAIGQLLFKHIGGRVHGMEIRAAMMAALSGPAIYAAVFLYGLSTLLWIWVLGRVPLTQAYPWVALGVIIVPWLSGYFFAEHTSPVFWLGAVLILCGIIITQYGVGTG